MEPSLWCTSEYLNWVKLTYMISNEFRWFISVYSLLNINNQQLDLIVQDKIFTNILDFVFMSSIYDMSSIFDRKFDQFYIEI